MSNPVSPPNLFMLKLSSASNSFSVIPGITLSRVRENASAAISPALMIHSASCPSFERLSSDMTGVASHHLVFFAEASFSHVA